MVAVPREIDGKLCFCLGQWWIFQMFRIIARGKLLLAKILCIFWHTITIYEKSSTGLRDKVL